MAEEARSFGTLADVARACGIDWKAADKHVKSGLFKAVSHGQHKGLFEVARCVELHRTARDPEAALKGVLGGSGASEISNNPLVKARTISAALEAQERQIKLARLKGELISKADAQAAAAAVVSVLVQRLDGLPAQAAAACHAAPSVPEAEAILRGLVRAIRVEVSKLGEVFDAR